MNIVIMLKNVEYEQIPILESNFLIIESVLVPFISPRNPTTCVHLTRLTIPHNLFRENQGEMDHLVKKETLYVHLTLFDKIHI